MPFSKEQQAGRTKPKPQRLGFGSTLAAAIAPMRKISEKRKNYLKASQRAERTKEARERVCAFFAAGAPSVVGGFIACDGTAHSLHEIAPRGAFGGLPVSDRFPSVGSCTFHNDWCQQAVEGREWARSHRFWDAETQREWPFLLSPTDPEVKAWLGIAPHEEVKE